MGWRMVTLRVRLVNPQTGVGVDVDAVVDSSKAFTIVGPDIAERLQLPLIFERRPGGVGVIQESYVIVEVGRERALTRVIVEDGVEAPVIGASVVEALGLSSKPDSQSSEDYSTLKGFKGLQAT